MEEQEKFMQLQMLDRQYSQTAEQLQMIEQEVVELDEFVKSLNHIEDSKETGMLAPLGRGVYVSAERELNEKLFVEVGAGVVVRKTIKEAVSVVSEQLEQLKAAYHQLKNQEAFFAAQLQQIMSN